MKVKYMPNKENNFHNRPAITVISKDGARINKRQAKRIENHFCGIKGCCCGKGDLIPLNEEGTEFELRLAYTIF